MSSYRGESYIKLDRMQLAGPRKSFFMSKANELKESWFIIGFSSKVLRKDTERVLVLLCSANSRKFLDLDYTMLCYLS
jgi:hypothetical protein